MSTNSKLYQHLRTLLLLATIAILLIGCTKIEALVSSPTPLLVEIATPEPSIDEIVADLEGLSLDDFFNASLNQLMLRDPEALTIFGLAESFGLRHDRLTNISVAYIHETQALEAAILDILHTYERTSLTPEQRLDYDIYEWYLDHQVRGHRFMYHHYRLHHFIRSYHFSLNGLFTRSHPLRNRENVEDYISRLSQVDTQVTQLMELMVTSEGMGIMPPRFIVELTRDELIAYLKTDATHISAIDPKSLDVYVHLEEALEEIDGLTATEKKAFLNAAQAQIQEAFIPAFLQLLEYQDHLLTIASDDAGAWKFPDGAAFYAYMLNLQTTTNLTPEEVHEIGLAEVARIQEEIRAVLVNMGYSEDQDLAEMMSAAIEDSGYYELSTQAGRDEILNDSKGYVAEMQQRLTEISDLQPAMELVVVGDQVPEFFYSRGIPGVRPGIFFVAWLGERYPKYTVPSIVYHEAIPGHYLQDAIMKGINLNPVRYTGNFDAYEEGWALYAEWLAWEMGAYNDDPYGNLGRLQGELLRAVRLVTDTGIHALGWTREEAQAYVDDATLTPGLYTREVDRYVVIPAQATAYKIGMLKILALRQKAMNELGDQFDLKEFHNIVLGNGSLPLEILEQSVDAYIEAKLNGTQ